MSSAEALKVSTVVDTESKSVTENKEKTKLWTSDTSENIHNNNTNGLKISESNFKMEENNRTTNELDNNGVCDYNKTNNRNKLGDNNNEDQKQEEINFKMTKDEFSNLSSDVLWEKWQLCIKRIEKFEAKINPTDDDESLKSQFSELQRKEAYQIMRLTAKEHELQEMITGATASKCLPINRGSFLDPAVNLCIERLKKELETAKTKMEEAQNELAAWKFTPDSNTGKQLMAKCRSLIKENEELGRVISSGKLSKLEGDIALQRNFTEELKKSQSELDEFLLEMDEDTEGMQGTIVYLQDQLRVSKQQLHQLQESSSSVVDSPAVTMTDTDKLDEESDTNNTPVEDTNNTPVEDTNNTPVEDTNNTPVEDTNNTPVEDTNNTPVEETIPPPSLDNDLSYSNVNNNNNNSDNSLKSAEIRTTNEKEILESLESQIIPHDQFDKSESDNDCDLVTNGKRTLDDLINVDIETEPSEGPDVNNVEPPCKKAKAFVLGENENSSETDGGGVENGN